MNIRIPEGRLRKFGYVEFEDRESLLEALALDDQVKIFLVVQIIHDQLFYGKRYFGSLHRYTWEPKALIFP